MDGGSEHCPAASNGTQGTTSVAYNNTVHNTVAPATQALLHVANLYELAPQVASLPLSPVRRRRRRRRHRRLRALVEAARRGPMRPSRRGASRPGLQLRLEGLNHREQVDRQLDENMARRLTASAQTHCIENFT